MNVNHLGQWAGYKEFIDWSNNTWQMGKSHSRKTPESSQLVTQLQSI